jgi:hypothetical protein
MFISMDISVLCRFFDKTHENPGRRQSVRNPMSRDRGRASPLLQPSAFERSDIAAAPGHCNKPPARWQMTRQRQLRKVAAQEQ